MNTPAKLAVLLHADVAGSTALVQTDEQIAHQRMRDAFRALREVITRYGGVTHEVRGDALVAEFDRVSSAVSSALAFQAENTGRNSSLADALTVPVRIGIALGEVVIADGTVTGTGVVLAQRLEQLAAPGGIVLQGAAHETIPKRMPFEYRDLGQQTLKGFGEPVRGVAVSLVPGLEVPPPPAPAGEPQHAPEAPAERVTIAVLPFENLSNDPDQSYFSDGISEDILTDLAKVSGLFVIARHSAFGYRDARDAGRAHDDLGVRYVLRGSVRRAGIRVRITAQMLDGRSGATVWSERYDRELDDIFAVQDEVVREIVAALAARVTPDERARLGVSSPRDIESYERFLQGRRLIFELTRAATDEAIALFETVTESNPRFAPAFTYLAMGRIYQYTNEWAEDPAAALRHAEQLAAQSVALDDNLSNAHWVLGLALMWMRQLDRAEFELKRAIELDPSNVHAHAGMCVLLTYAGRPEEAVGFITTAMRLDPHYPPIFLHFLGHATFVSGHYEDAAEKFRRRIQRQPGTDISRVLLASSLGHLGMAEEANAEWKEALKVNPRYSLEHKRRIMPYRDEAEFERILSGLQGAGVVP